MQKLRPLRPFNYSNDRFIIADMDGREKSYIAILEKHINELTATVNDLIDSERVSRVGEAESIRLEEQEAAKIEKKKEKKDVRTNTGTINK